MISHKHLRLSIASAIIVSAVLLMLCNADSQVASPESGKASSPAFDKWKSENNFPRLKEFLAALSDKDKEQLNQLFNDGIDVASSTFSPVIIPSDFPTKQTTVLSFPFSGEYFVIQGNSSWVSHKKGTGNEFALDLVIQKNGGMVFGNSGKNDKYYAWGQPALAPADGVVVKIRDGNDDHPPLTQKLNDGNFVRIEHLNGEQSLIYHLMKGSITVKEGQQVSRGDAIGRVGDSGISVFPHIHYQLDRKEGEKTRYAPPVFSCYFARRKDETEWRLVINGTPQEGEYIADVNTRLNAQPAN